MKAPPWFCTTRQRSWMAQRLVFWSPETHKSTSPLTHHPKGSNPMHWMHHDEPQVFFTASAFEPKGAGFSFNSFKNSSSQGLQIHPHAHTHGGGDGHFAQIDTLAGSGLGLVQSIDQCGQIALQLVALK